MSYQDAIKYLESFINYEKIPNYSYKDSFKLQKIKDFLKLLGNPQDFIRAIHVAGTKGKGSTCVMVASVLRQAGFNVGLYTSPHLIDFRERIRILDERFSVLGSRFSDEFEGMISEGEVIELVEYLKPHIDKFNEISKWDSLTFFEVYTTLAFEYFKRKNLDFVVLETGLGGRLDATNVVNPIVCAITSIGLEHMDKLGTTLTEIATEKAGIIKENSLVITAPQAKEAMDVIESACTLKNSRLYKVGEDVKFDNVHFYEGLQKFDVKGINAEYKDIELSLLGLHQIINAALSIGIIEMLSSKEGIDIKEDSIKKALTQVNWSGRLDVVSKNPLVVLDGAQTPDSAKALSISIKKFFEYNRIILILGISSDKDIKGLSKELANIADKIILTKANSPRAADPHIMAEFFKDRDFMIQDTVEKAIEKAKDIYLENDLILITGSLFVVGQAMKYFMKTLTTMG